jgi:enoyl-CoA hydratase/carnithine racemase
LLKDGQERISQVSDYQTIRMEKRTGLGYLTLNRPQVRNAFSREMIDELQQALAGIDKDNEIRVLIITGAGQAFQAGADICAGMKGLCASMPPWKNSVSRLSPRSMALPWAAGWSWPWPVL